MKKIITSIFLALPFVVSAQALQRITENSNTGWRFSTANSGHYGDIGDEAVDLSWSFQSSSTFGATGNFSYALGYRATASNTATTAMGHTTTASGYSSTAMGFGTTASGDHSTAMGKNTTASGYGSVAMGDQNTASGSRAFAMGYWNNLASGENSVAMGYNTTASGSSSVAMGSNTTASANYSTAIGYKTTASGNNSFAIGEETTASDYGSLSIGLYNSVNSSVTTGGSATAFDTDNAAFVVGNGYVDDSDFMNPFTVNSDALVVYFNGNATLAGDLTINSDARLKENIQPLGSTLDKLHQIEGKTYTFLKDEEHTPKIGVLAQEVQAVFPELVTEGADGILSVNYQGLVPVLINAINEQEAKIAALEAQNAEIKELKEMVRVLSLQQSQATSSVASN